MKIQKRDGRVVPYEEEKIREAIHKANNEVEERYRASEGLIEEILEDVQQEGRQTQTVEHIQDMIEEHLVEHNKYTLAKKYIVYRYQRSLLRKSNTTDESILKLIRNENKELAEENSNKNTILASTQRDYIAGEVSRDLTKRRLPLRETILRVKCPVTLPDVCFCRSILPWRTTTVCCISMMRIISSSRSSTVV